PTAPGAEARAAAGAPVPDGEPPVTAAGAPGNAPTGANAGQPAPAAPVPPSAPAYPFSRPQGESLAAWGIREGNAPRQAAAPAAPARAAAAAPVRQPDEPRFDHVFQAAAFRGPADAERLRGRLEEAGLRARVRQSGKVRLVLVSVRGSVRDADRVRGELAAMGLGRPILLEKKPVAEKTGGKGRRRSAP
ncbi:SPOR domain-containing protein, partial [uncultured Desulfovibrio sp.]